MTVDIHPSSMHSTSSSCHKVMLAAKKCAIARCADLQRSMEGAAAAMHGEYIYLAKG